MPFSASHLPCWGPFVMSSVTTGHEIDSEAGIYFTCWSLLYSADFSSSADSQRFCCMRFCMSAVYRAFFFLSFFFMHIYDEQIMLKSDRSLSRFDKMSICLALLLPVRLVDSLRNIYWFVCLFVFRSGKCLVLPTMQRVWCRKLETDWTPSDNSLVSSKYVATEAVVSDTMTPFHSWFSCLLRPEITVMVDWA